MSRMINRHDLEACTCFVSINHLKFCLRYSEPHYKLCRNTFVIRPVRKLLSSQLAIPKARFSGHGYSFHAILSWIFGKTKDAPVTQKQDVTKNVTKTVPLW